MLIMKKRWYLHKKMPRFAFLKGSALVEVFLHFSAVTELHDKIDEVVIFEECQQFQYWRMTQSTMNRNLNVFLRQTENINKRDVMIKLSSIDDHLIQIIRCICDCFQQFIWDFYRNAPLAGLGMWDRRGAFALCRSSEMKIVQTEQVSSVSLCSTNSSWTFYADGLADNPYEFRNELGDHFWNVKKSI